MYSFGEPNIICHIDQKNYNLMYKQNYNYEKLLVTHKNLYI